MELPIINVTGCILYDRITITRQIDLVLQKYETVSDFIYIVFRESDANDIKKYCDYLGIDLTKYDSKFGVGQYYSLFFVKELLGCSWFDTIKYSLASWGVEIDDQRIDKNETNMEFPLEVVEYYKGWKHEMWGEEGDRLIKKIKGLTESVVFLPGEWDKTTDEQKYHRLDEIERQYQIDTM